VTYKVLLNQDPGVRADMVILLVDASNLKRNLLFCSQIIDLKIPVVVALDHDGPGSQKGIEIDVEGLERELGIPVVAVNPRKNKGIPQLKKVVEWRARQLNPRPSPGFYQQPGLAAGAIQDVKKLFPEISDYTAIHYLINHEHFRFCSGAAVRCRTDRIGPLISTTPAPRPKRSSSATAVSNRSCSIR
jgi:ferrous iron transport protein B